MARREKELSKEEALELARKELAPLWIGTKPLLAAIRGNGRAEAVPLEPAIRTGVWLLVFADPAEFEGLRAIRAAKLHHDRYSALGLSTLAVLRPPFASWRNQDSLRPLLADLAPGLFAAIDADRLLSAAFGTESAPAGAVILDPSGVLALVPRLDESFELSVQERLRRDDPGLAMTLPYHSRESPIEPVSAIDFGEGRGAVFPSPGFRPTQNGARTARFAPEAAARSPFSLSGEWTQDADGISTSDPYATLAISSPSDVIGLLARSLAPAHEPVTIEIESASQGSVPRDQAGRDLDPDDHGASTCRVGEPRLLEIARHLSPEHRVLTLRFPGANARPVQVHGLRFGHLRD